MLNPALLAMGLLLQLGQLQIPQPVGYVNDFARVIRPDAAARMASVIAAVRTKSRGEIVVVTLPDLRGRDPADVAREIGRQWRVGARGEAGDRARNTGVVILVVPVETSSDGKGYTRIDVGSGAEGFLTDATVGAIQDEAVPLLSARDYSTALELETVRVAERFAREFGFALEPGASPVQRQPARRSRGSGIPPFFWVILFIIILGASRRRRRRGGIGNALFWMALNEVTRGGRSRGWGGHSGFSGGGGGGGGGFSGFGGFGGGGGFSGGGAGRSF